MPMLNAAPTRAWPSVDRPDFEDVEAHGLERWLGELALALRQETYQPDPIRRVSIPKANGKLRPLGVSTLRDRVCMTAAIPRALTRGRSSRPTFHRNSPPTVAGETPNRRWSRWRSCCFAAIRTWWTPTSRTTWSLLHNIPRFIRCGRRAWVGSLSL